MKYVLNWWIFFLEKTWKISPPVNISLEIFPWDLEHMSCWTSQPPWIGSHFPSWLLVNLPTKSMEIISQGRVRIGKRWYKPCFMLLGLLVQQSMHPIMNQLATCSCILGQYTYLCKLVTIFPTPKRPVTLEVWVFLINCSHSPLGTHSSSNL